MLLVKVHQACFIGRLHQDTLQRRPSRHMGLQIAIGFHRDQLTARGQPIKGLAQVLARHTFDLVGMGQQGLE